MKKEIKKTLLPLNLQLFAEPGEGEGAHPAGGTQTPPATPQFDYEKLAKIIAGKQTATEDTVLKGYFKQQGLSQQEAEQAMLAFKQQKAANTPDVDTMQTQLKNALADVQKSQIENAAIMEAVGLGIDIKSVPYLIKMADMSQALGEDGKVNQEGIKNALNKVLEDVPALKPAPAATGGFVQVGTNSGQGATGELEDQIAAAFGNTKK